MGLAIFLGATVLLASSDATTTPRRPATPPEVVQKRPVLTLGVDLRATDVRFDDNGTLLASLVERISPQGESYATLSAPQMTQGSEWRIHNGDDPAVRARVEGCGEDVALVLLDASGRSFGRVRRHDTAYELGLGDLVFQNTGLRVDGAQQLVFSLRKEGHAAGVASAPRFTLVFHANNALSERRGFSVRVLNTQGLPTDTVRRLPVAATWMMAFMLHQPLPPVSGPSHTSHVGNRLALLAGRVPDVWLATSVPRTTPSCPTARSFHRQLH